MVKMFTREELQRVAEQANALNSVQGFNADWHRALRDFAFAAAVLDAFLLRAAEAGIVWNVEEAPVG